MPEARAPYRIEFYEDDEGHEPALAFIRSCHRRSDARSASRSNELLAHLARRRMVRASRTLKEGPRLHYKSDLLRQILRLAMKHPTRPYSAPSTPATTA